VKPGFQFIGFQGLRNQALASATGRVDSQLVQLPTSSSSSASSPLLALRLRLIRERLGQLARAVAAQVAFWRRQQGLKPGYHVSGSRVVKPGTFTSYGSQLDSQLGQPGYHISGSRLETRCVSSYGSTAFNSCTAPRLVDVEDEPVQPAVDAPPLCSGAGCI
jgi:hypothetical protein